MTCLTLLFSLSAIGQNVKQKSISNTELKLFKDLILSLNDTSFVISPMIEDDINASMLNISQLSHKYGFTRSQFRNKSKDMIQIRKNKYFEIANPDSLIKFSHLGSYLKLHDSIYIFEPYYYSIEKTYHKKCICYFNKTIFSKNKTYAVAYYMISCGMDDGRGETVLMKKIRNKWIIIKNLVFHGS